MYFSSPSPILWAGMIAMNRAGNVSTFVEFVFGSGKTDNKQVCTMLGDDRE